MSPSGEIRLFFFVGSKRKKHSLHHVSRSIHKLIHRMVFAGIIGVFLWYPQNVAAADTSGERVTPRNILRQVNADRMRYGLMPLTIDFSLQKAAQKKADDMASRGYFSHGDPDGHLPWSWIDGEGYDYAIAGENLAIGYLSAVAQEDAWMESEFHRRNILNPDYRDTGIAVVQGSIRGQEELLVVQFFGATTPVAAPVPTHTATPAVRGVAVAVPADAVAAVAPSSVRRIAVAVFLLAELAVSVMIAAPLLFGRHRPRLALAGAVL